MHAVKCCALRAANVAPWVPNFEWSDLTIIIIIDYVDLLEYSMVFKMITLFRGKESASESECSERCSIKKLYYR